MKYFEKRIKTYPQSVKGRYRSIKNILSPIFLIIYLGAPFLRWHRGSNISNQAILIDLPHHRGFFFMIEIWPQEIYYLVGILIFAAVALFFITSLFGRVWCGYSCPQTVWTDLFIKIEKFFQGDRNERILLDRKSFSLEKLARKTATHLAWIIIGLITGFGFTAYFNDIFLLTHQIINLNPSPTVLGWIIGIAGATYIMAGFAREQVCNYMCPYARFQSAMFDRDTLIISYNKKRGEPRQKYKKDEDMSARGHCIDCKQCVVVCPANIDIRNGLQMECIACGLCIDACNSVMAKIGLPPGLIRYDTERNLENNNSVSAFKILRPRSFYYAGILILVGGIILSSLILRPKSALAVIPDRNPLFVLLSNGDIRNGYVIRIANKTYQNKKYHLQILGIDDLAIKIDGLEDSANLPVAADDINSFKIYVIANQEKLNNSINGRNKISFEITDDQALEKIKYDTVFISN